MYNTLGLSFETRKGRKVMCVQCIICTVILSMEFDVFILFIVLYALDAVTVSIKQNFWEIVSYFPNGGGAPQTKLFLVKFFLALKLH